MPTYSQILILDNHITSNIHVSQLRRTPIEWDSACPPAPYPGQNLLGPPRLIYARLENSFAMIRILRELERKGDKE